MTTTDQNSAAPPVYGLVMAGGQSTRMGMDKSALDFHGKPQGIYCSELLGAVLERVCISVRKRPSQADVFQALPQIEDAYGAIGPMSGVLSAMDQEPDAAWFVLACDLPYIDEQAVRELLDGRARDRMATAFMASDGFFEPLCAIYEPRTAPLLRERLDAGRYSLRDVLTDADVRMVCPPEDRMLTNVNTPEDLEEVRAHLAAERAGLS